MNAIKPSGSASRQDQEPKIALVVEHDADMRQVLADSLTLLGCVVVQAGTAEQAFERLRDRVPVVVITALRIPGGGLRYVSQLRQAVGSCPIIVVTEYGDARTRQDVLIQGGSAYFDKPISLVTLCSVASTLVSHYTSQTGMRGAT